MMTDRKGCVEVEGELFLLAPSPLFNALRTSCVDEGNFHPVCRVASEPEMFQKLQKEKEVVRGPTSIFP